MSLSLVHAAIIAALVFMSTLIAYQRGTLAGATNPTTESILRGHIATLEHIAETKDAIIDALERNVTAKERTIEIYKQQLAVREGSKP